jgi:hypothetical protein
MASIQSQRPRPDKQERVVMGRPEESRLSVGGAVEAAGESVGGKACVGGGMMMASSAEEGWGGIHTRRSWRWCGGRCSGGG